MKLTFLRRLVYTCIGIVLSLLALELITFAGYFVTQRHVFPYTEYQTDMLKRGGQHGLRRLPGLANAGQVGHTVIHPYLGFVPDPGKDGTTIGDANQVLSRSPDKLIVGVFGGSFAGGLCNYSRAELARVLQVPGRQVTLLCFGAGVIVSWMWIRCAFASMYYAVSELERTKLFFMNAHSLGKK